jgi:hypothetical protein
MAKLVAPRSGVIVGFLLDVIAGVALDSWLSPPGTVFGMRDEMGIGHEFVPVLTGIVVAIPVGLLSRLWWGEQNKP